MKRKGFRCMEMTLSTQGVLVVARKIYQDTGFTLVATEPCRSVGVDLVGETWEMEFVVIPGRSEGPDLRCEIAPRRMTSGQIKPTPPGLSGGADAHRDAA